MAALIPVEKGLFLARYPGLMTPFVVNEVSTFSWEQSWWRYWYLISYIALFVMELIFGLATNCLAFDPDVNLPPRTDSFSLVTLLHCP